MRLAYAYPSLERLRRGTRRQLALWAPAPLRCFCASLEENARWVFGTRPPGVRLAHCGGPLWIIVSSMGYLKEDARGCWKPLVDKGGEPPRV